MADFEVLGCSIAGHAGYDADGFAESLRFALDGTVPGRVLTGQQMILTRSWYVGTVACLADLLNP